MLLLEALSNSSIQERKKYWNLLLLCHKKNDVGWEQTTLRYLFEHENAIELKNIRETALELKKAISLSYSTIIGAFQSLDNDKDGLLSQDDIKNFLIHSNCKINEDNLTKALLHSIKKGSGTYRKIIERGLMTQYIHNIKLLENITI